VLFGHAKISVREKRIEEGIGERSEKSVKCA